MKDKYLIIGFVLIGLVIGAVVLITGKTGARVEVSVDGRLVDSYDLEDEIDTHIDSEYGSNHLVIRDGKARILDATCPDGLCVKMGEISRAGQSIICLPNRVVVEIIGAESDKKVDTFAGGGK